MDAIHLGTTEGMTLAGSGRAKRFRQARELKQGGPQRVCDYCHANQSLGETHDPDCEYAAKVDPYAEEDADSETEEEAW